MLLGLMIFNQPSLRSSRRSSRGFTLVELMAVVTITGILAAIGIMLVRKHIQDAKTTEAFSVIQAIRSAQESYRAQHGLYLDCSTSAAKWYPAAPDAKARAWKQPDHVDAANWTLLAVPRQDPTQFGFLVDSGNPGAAIPQPVTAFKPAWPTPVDPWYLIQAAGDRDADSKFSYVLASSLNGEVYVESDGE